ncbi:MAG: hypothetical protein H6719_31440, partial [Sandaracinaceae bacterium]|nr:hypothetical protein [Sandaracinaceae bacterium]
RHYLADAESVPAVLVGVIDRELPGVMSLGEWSHPTQGAPPAEYLHFITRGMQKAPEQRWGSATEMIQELQGALDGNIRVQCPMTFTKRLTRESGKLVDRYPRASVFGFLATAIVVLFGLTASIVALVT